MFGVCTFFRVLKTSISTVGRIIHFPVWILLRKPIRLAVLPAPPLSPTPTSPKSCIIPVPSPPENFLPSPITPATVRHDPSMKAITSPTTFQEVICIPAAPQLEVEAPLPLPAVTASRTAPTASTVNLSPSVTEVGAVCSTPSTATPLCTDSTLESEHTLVDPHSTSPTVASFALTSSLASVDFEEEVPASASVTNGAVVAGAAKVHGMVESTDRIKEPSGWEMLFGPAPRQTVKPRPHQVVQPAPIVQTPTVLSGYTPKFSMGGKEDGGQAGRNSRGGRRGRRRGRK